MCRKSDEPKVSLKQPGYYWRVEKKEEEKEKKKKKKKKKEKKKEKEK